MSLPKLSLDEARKFVDDLWSLVDQAKADGDFGRARELEADARDAELKLATHLPITA